TRLFTFDKEDHTLANLISQRLLKYDFIEFSGYKVQHPHFELRVTTDGTITPREAVKNCCEEVIGDLESMKKSFQDEFQKVEITQEG
ncbi:RBP11-like subunits of RNA polymerase, partial [Ophiobolus disseminans]